MERWEEYYRSQYKQDRYTKEDLIDEIINLKAQINWQRAIEVDQQWISKYKEMNKNLYALHADIIAENQHMKKELQHIQEMINEEKEGVKEDKELLGL